MEVQMASQEDAAEIPQQIGELLGEIMDATGQKAFNFKFEEARLRPSDFPRQKYFVLVTHIYLFQLQSSLVPGHHRLL